MCNFNFDLKKVLSHAMVPREGFNDLNQSAHPCLSAKMKTQARLGTGHGKSTMANVCGDLKKCGWKKASISAHD